MNSRTCPYCHSTTKRQILTKDWNSRVDTKDFAYRCCEQCGLVAIDQIPADLGKYYAQNYGPYQRPSTQAQLRERFPAVQGRVDLIQRFKRAGSLLEIGPSYGAFALLAKESGFDVETIEMDHDCCEFMRKELGLKVVEASDIVASVQGQGQYDVIALWHNIEHLPEPWNVLQILAKHLKPGGILALSSPNPGALQFRILGGKWAHLDAPRHLYMLPRSLYHRILSPLGLREMAFVTDDIENKGLTHTGWSASFKAQAGKRGSFRYLLAQISGRLASMIFSGIETGERAASYAILYQKN